jgi:hypothetical protein
MEPLPRGILQRHARGFIVGVLKWGELAVFNFVNNILIE